MNILVTGATGFVGKNFLNYIKENNLFINDQIILLSSKKISGYKCILHKDYTFSKEDFIKNGIDKIDILIHIGAFSPKIKADMNNVEKNFYNIYNTSYLLNNIVSITKKIIYISTISVYDLKASLPITEQTETNPNDIYGVSKLYSEKTIQKYCKQKDLACSILRLGVVYGNNDAYSGFIPTVIKKIIQHKSPEMYNGGKEIKNFIHVRDCSRVISKAVELQTKNEIVNVVSSENLPVNQIIKKILKISKKDLEILNKEVPEKLLDIVFDNNHLLKLYGDNMLSLEQGLTDAYLYFEKKEELLNACN